MIVVITGVAGAGKSTIGRALADRLGWPYLEADDFHPEANRRKMERGVALSEEDRGPWLEAMAVGIHAAGDHAVVSCSCLQRAHRRRLGAARPDVRFAFLRIDPEVAKERVEERSGHFFEADLVDSQFDTLEAPADALVLDARRPPAELVDALTEWIREARRADPRGGLTQDR